MIMSGKRIFIVEDNALNRVVYQMTLGVQGGAFLVFDRWGRETVTRLREAHNWDLIILDLMLHRGISGFDIFQEIRALPAYDAIPIVAISASEPAVALPKARDLGFSGFISKPIDEANFVDQIRRVIEGEKVWVDGTLVGH